MASSRMPCCMLSTSCLASLTYPARPRRSTRQE
uniref:Uncharacterized protein n=1 Tax=Arundo donax TaxID=35708 RepID=A0A0A9CAA3_ARUDO